MNPIDRIFDDKKIVKKIQRKLPFLFALAEKEASRGGKLGMEIGTVRERILIAILIEIFGSKNVDPDIPITEPEVDVELFRVGLSIKTKTGASYSGIKVIWTVDWDKVREFLKSYAPSCDLLLIRINWDKEGGFYFIPLEVQKEVFKKIGGSKYLKPPPPNTNPRGVEFSKEAMKEMIEHKNTKKIPITWKRPKIEYDPYKPWIEKWNEE